jgi:signal transduction histidine kinase
VADAEFLLAGLFQRHMEQLTAAFAVTRGAAHTLVYANAAFRHLTDTDAATALGRPIVQSLAGHETGRLTDVLDRVTRTGSVALDQPIDPRDDGATAWCCSVWPELDEAGRPEHLLIEIRETAPTARTVALQREVAERMLISALREHEAADNAEASSLRATHLASEGRRLAESLDEGDTLNALTRLALPRRNAWCIVDIIEGDGAMRRLAMIHPDPGKQALLLELAGRWTPESGDPFGAPAALRRAEPMVIDDAVDAALVAAAHDPETLRTLRAVGAGSLLTVPLTIRDVLVGAITFVSGHGDLPYTEQDVKLAEDLTIRSAMALYSARLHGEAIALHAKAEAASRAKTEFLGTMSHELRTPLNAIGGYVELIDMGLRGPVTDAQHVDLGRIRSNQLHLMGLVTDVLNLVRVGSGRVLYGIADVSAHDVLVAAVAMVEPLILQKSLVYDVVDCDRAIIARADREKVIQILVNLLSNAIKFTREGGGLDLACDATEETVNFHVSDTGIGIPADKHGIIFEPFVQVREGLAGRDTGVGLGLAISRDLARAMHGDLAVESAVDKGSRFTLSLPRSRPAQPEE